ncbi:alpha/beta hydrolase family protein [Stratiformator vulcanicus]|uniref:4-O-methyl-glucuronoyl methylesterase-like domain-containing protein n=1 Tax=Stratiformator vulcanicus TaxID=2527980 RepID=A0A517QW06_9PLAN|nr:acetylxylan esterase [Stratiformator vulcanicus]QDT35753.1 hypothetical protein Pan189_01060 [Stratiformator vulcanicus]
MSRVQYFLTPLLCVACGGIGSAGELWEPTEAEIKQAEAGRTHLTFREAEVEPYELPPLLKRADGTVVETADEWQARRAELLTLFEEHVYGRLPGPPEEMSFELLSEDMSAVDGKATRRKYRIDCQSGGRTFDFEFHLVIPNGVDPKKVDSAVPVFLLISHRSFKEVGRKKPIDDVLWPVDLLIERGYGTAIFVENQLSPDNRTAFDSGLVELHPQSDPRPADGWGGLAAWGWGASRVLDCFEEIDEVDASKVAVLGHSRGGKSALWAGARDDRFGLVISNNSGCGGAALSRRRFGETIAVILREDRFPYWFAPKFQDYKDREAGLPIDQHMLLALVAPRPLYVASATEDLWADPKGEYQALAHASKVYELHGHDGLDPERPLRVSDPIQTDRLGHHLRPGKHDLSRKDWTHYIDFADHLWPKP